MRLSARAGSSLHVPADEDAQSGCPPVGGRRRKVEQIEEGTSGRAYSGWRKSHKLRALGTLFALVLAGLLGIASAGALAEDSLPGTTTAGTETAITEPVPDPAPPTRVPTPDPAPASPRKPVEATALPRVRTSEGAQPLPAAARAPKQAQPGPAVRTTPQAAGRPAVHLRRSLDKPTLPARHKRVSQRRAVGVVRPSIPPTTFGSADSWLPPLFLLFVALGLSITMLAATPRWALERTWILRPLVAQRPHVAMTGVTIVVFTGMAYLLGHWSP